MPLRLLWKARKNSAYRKRVLERFAFFKFPMLQDSIWLHAVSVGEVISAIPLIKNLMREYPGTTIVVTTMTPTGASCIQKIFKDKVLQLYVPYDYPFAVKRFLHYMNPKILILMEAELWPNILHYAAQYKIPIVIANACISERSFANYKKIRSLIQSMLGYVTSVAVQSKIDAARFIDLGLDPEKILITGSVKFDIQIPDDILERALQFRVALGKNRPIWIAASTHQGEEEKVLNAAKQVQQAIPDSLLILVPRHQERFNEVFALCNQQGFNVVRYSEQHQYSGSTNIVLGDAMGQLLFFYAASDIAFVGGSLIHWGGHNLLEPAALAKPIISGRNLEEFREISQILTDADALILVDDEAALAQNVINLFQNKVLQEKLGCAALDVVNKHRGATQTVLNLLRKAL